ncbi:polymer-forming cytoskeletal protein [Vibrio sp. SS-MA-C1-2]|uniref:bactofilin family protein n=1 Tax=Vibrio sp. SS-MA-C1-2 TaxID=2908646 RepID=UPI001F1C997E|nr:polymer-forming cytoskeletal protein [Vibrio sp. SS-MA-C1-2]UJF17760.1 polymer-forming cytoskeletal protein [Vibrio sp. SS-MA-C1-2]
MALFNNNKNNTSTNKAAKAMNSTIIAEGTRIKGTLELSNDIQVDGYVEGKITTDQTLIVSNTGRMKGEIYANKMVVNGKIEGSCYANTIEVMNNGHVSGTIYCNDLSIDRGGRFNGESFPLQDETIELINKPVAAEELESQKQLEKA